MYKKTCPKCLKPSFSSCDTGPWTCPTCKNNLTFITPQDAENPKQSKPRLFLIKNTHIQENPQLNSKIKPFNFQSYD